MRKCLSSLFISCFLANNIAFTTAKPLYICLNNFLKDEVLIYPEIFILTHTNSWFGNLLEIPFKKLHKKTPSLKELPAIFLEGWDDPVNMQWGYEYAQPAFYLRSYDGEISKKIISSKIHLAGGFDQLCLRRTIQDLTRYFDQSSLSEMSLFIYPELIISQHILLRPHSVLDKYHFSLLESILNPYHQTQTFHETLDTWMTSIMGFFEYKIQGWYQDESTLKLKINIKDILYTNNSNSNFLESKLSDNKKFFLILSIEENRETSQVTIFIQNTYPEISPVE